jgi:hypothetical protein
MSDDRKTLDDVHMVLWLRVCEARDEREELDASHTRKSLADREDVLRRFEEWRARYEESS